MTAPAPVDVELPSSQSVLVVPEHLLFESTGPPDNPFHVPIPVKLTISNANTKAVNFKVKTTAPRRYYVRPNAGIMDPGQKVEIEVVLQPQAPDLIGLQPGGTVVDKKMLRDKFALQVAFKDTPMMSDYDPIHPEAGHVKDVSDWWKMLENKSKNKNKLDERGKPIPDWTQIRLQSSLKILLAGEGKIMDKLEEENQQLKGMNKQLEAALAEAIAKAQAPEASASTELELREQIGKLEQQLQEKMDEITKLNAGAAGSSAVGTLTYVLLALVVFMLGPPHIILSECFT